MKLKSAVISVALLLLFCGEMSAQSQLQSDSLRGVRLMEEAAALDKEGRYQEAISIYENSLIYFEKCRCWFQYFRAKIGIAYDYLDGNHYHEAKNYIAATITEFDKVPAAEVPLSKLGDAWLCKGNIHNYLFEFEPAIASFEKALEAYQSLPDNDEMKDKGATFAYNNLGSVNLKSRNFSNALEYLTLALETKKKVFGPTHQRTLNSMYLLSETWSQMGFLNKALEMLSQILEIEKAAGEADGIAHCYREISKVYQHKKDFKTAEEYIRRAIDFYQNTTARTVYKTAICEHQMGNVLMDGGRYAESIPWFEKANAKHLQIHGGLNFDSGLSTMNIGTAHTFMDNYAEGLKYYQEAKKMFKASVSDDNPRYVELWLVMGICLNEKDDRDAAHELFSKAYDLAKAKIPERTYDRAQACYHLASTTENTEQALALCQEGLQEVSTDFVSQNLFDNPSPQSIFHEQAALPQFQQKIYFLEKLFDETNELVYLEKALTSAQVASELVDLLRQSFYNESAKTELAAEARKIYEAGVRLAFRLQEVQSKPQYLELVFQFMEKSRSLILLEDLHRDAASQMTKIPDSLAFRSEVLKKEILHLETEFQLAKNDQEKRQKLNEKIFDAKEEFNALEKYIEENFAEISQLKNNLENISIADVQRQLETGEVVLEYLIADEELYLLKLSIDIQELSKVDLPENFQEEIISFVRNLKDPQLAANSGMDLETYLDFSGCSRNIFEIIIGDALTENENQLLLIPDQYLSFLPFELLLTDDSFSKEKVDYADLPYLFVKHPVRYAFSSNLQFNKPDYSKTHNTKVLAYAPEYEGSSNPELATREGFSALTQTVKEVADIQELMNSEAVTGKAASEKSFKEKAGKFGILHLAMHAFTDEENPMISGLIFTENNDDEDDVLRAYELQSMQLNAQLAVLSACNTGSGKLEKGEGIMSLGRGFRRAGVPNILMSLWQVDDESTRQIMGSFYQHLKAGRPTDEALRQAKLDYLQTGRKSFPFYWSAFVLMGDNEGLDFVQDADYQRIVFVGLISVLLAGLSFWGYRKFA